MKFLQILLGAASLLAVATGASRNVVLFVADDHGQDAGVYGNPVIRPPHIDRLAAEGTRFRYAFAGRSFLGILEEARPQGWDEIYASHTFHEIQMYYPMRAVRTRHYKLVWNLAHPLPFPFASDLWVAAAWQYSFQQRMNAAYGVPTVGEYIHRPEFELFDVVADPWESKNLAADRPTPAFSRN